MRRAALVAVHFAGGFLGANEFIENGINPVERFELAFDFHGFSLSHLALWDNPLESPHDIAGIDRRKTIGGGIPVAAYGMSAEVAAKVEEMQNDEGIDVSGVGGTLAGNALSMAAVRATLTSALLPEQFVKTKHLAENWTDGVRKAYEKRGLPWSVQRLGCRAEYWFCPPPKNGAQAAAAMDHDLDAFMHLWAINRGVLLTPFHNMALFSPFHEQADVDRHTEVFEDALDALVG